MHIVVRTPSGRTVPVEVELSDSVKKIKGEIERKAGIRADQQRVSIARTSRQLEDDDLLMGYDFEETDTLDLATREPGSISVIHTDGTQHIVPVADLRGQIRIIIKEIATALQLDWQRIVLYDDADVLDELHIFPGTISFCPSHRIATVFADEFYPAVPVPTLTIR